MPTLFEDLQQQCLRTTTVAYIPGGIVTDPQTGQMTPSPQLDAKPIKFEIHNLTPNQLTAADAVLNAAKPPPLYEEVAKPGIVGTTKVLIGRDLDDPDYLAERQRLLPTRSALICLHGCPALRDSVPGNTPNEQADALNKAVSVTVIDWLASQIEGLSILTAVTEEEVASFFPKGSGAPKNSGSSRNRTRATAKKKPSKG